MGDAVSTFWRKIQPIVPSLDLCVLQHFSQKRSALHPWLLPYFSQTFCEKKATLSYHSSLPFPPLFDFGELSLESESPPSFFSPPSASLSPHRNWRRRRRGCKRFIPTFSLTTFFCAARHPSLSFEKKSFAEY